MTLKKFISEYDFENSVVLLEGKRNVLEEDKEKLIALGKLLASLTKHILFRSGNADGADYFFSHGVALENNKRLQAIIPYSGHRQKENQAFETISIDEISISSQTRVLTESCINRNIENSITRYLKGEKSKFAMKAPYLIRDTVKAIGTDDIKPASFGIFYDDLRRPRSGGTGYTMKICSTNNIPVINQRTWFNWL